MNDDQRLPEEVAAGETWGSLDDLVRRGAQRMPRKALEEEMSPVECHERWSALRASAFPGTDCAIVGAQFLEEVPVLIYRDLNIENGYGITGPRSHPWSVSTHEPRHRYVDFKVHPNLVLSGAPSL